MHPLPGTNCYIMICAELFTTFYVTCPCIVANVYCSRPLQIVGLSYLLSCFHVVGSQWRARPDYMTCRHHRVKQGTLLISLFFVNRNDSASVNCQLWLRLAGPGCVLFAVADAARLSSLLPVSLLVGRLRARRRKI